MQALYTAYAAALDDADYSAAIVAASKALALLGTTPNVSRDLHSGSQSIGWNDGATIQAAIAEARRLQRAASVGSAGVFGQSKITYARAEDTS